MSMLFRLRNTEAEGGKGSRSVISCYTAELIGNRIVNAKCCDSHSGIDKYSSLLAYDAV